MASFVISTECSFVKTDVDREPNHEHFYYGEIYQTGEQAKEPIFADSWISPSGKQYIVGMCGHQHSATFHSNWTKPTEEFDKASTRSMWAADELEKTGWIHFGLDYDCPIVEYTSRVNVTQAQRDTLFDILMQAKKAEEDGIDMHSSTQLENLAHFINNR